MACYIDELTKSTEVQVDVRWIDRGRMEGRQKMTISGEEERSKGVHRKKLSIPGRFFLTSSTRELTNSRENNILYKERSGDLSHVTEL